MHKNFRLTDHVGCKKERIDDAGTEYSKLQVPIPRGNV